MSWVTKTAPEVRTNRPLIYFIQIMAPNCEYRYVGKTSSQKRFRKDYHDNVDKIFKGEIKRKGSEKYRWVHLFLAVAVEEGWHINHTAIENVPRQDLNARKRELINNLKCNLNGKRQWAIEEYGQLKSELIDGTEHDFK